MKPNGSRRSYLLRLWCERDSAPPQWRASLQEIHSGAVRGFAGVAELCIYLHCETAVAAKETFESDDEDSLSSIGDRA